MTRSESEKLDGCGDRSAENSESNSGKRGGNNPQNLTSYQFKPGHSGNPGGRPKKSLLTDAYANLLQEQMPDDPLHRTYAQLIALAVIREAMGGKVQAAAEIADRVEGRVKPRSEDIEDGSQRPVSVSVDL